MSLGHPSAIYKTSSTKHCALQPVLSVRRDFGLAHYRILGCEKRFITLPNQVTCRTQKIEQAESMSPCTSQTVRT